jgi:hypothetical protein
MILVMYALLRKPDSAVDQLLPHDSTDISSTKREVL